MNQQQFFALEPQIKERAQKTKLFDLPRIIADWLEPYGGFRNKRVLDFGCAMGEMAAGIAFGHEPALVVGSDIKTEVGLTSSQMSELGLAELPPNLRYESIKPGQICSETNLDVVVSWSTFEHIERSILDDVIRDVRNSMSDGGLLFIQISPLYFSPEGSHLWDLGYGAWDHLLKQTSEVRGDIDRAPTTEARRKKLWFLFETLNRLTAPELVKRLEDSGFEVLREQRDLVDADPPAVLRHAYTEEALKTHQIVLLLTKRALPC